MRVDHPPRAVVPLAGGDDLHALLVAVDVLEVAAGPLDRRVRVCCRGLRGRRRSRDLGGCGLLRLVVGTVRVGFDPVDAEPVGLDSHVAARPVVISQHAQVVGGEFATVFLPDEGDVPPQVPVERLDLGLGRLVVRGHRFSTAFTSSLRNQP
jgi:hypothetical protein